MTDYTERAAELLPCECGHDVEALGHRTTCPSIRAPAVAAALREVAEEVRRETWTPCAVARALEEERERCADMLESEMRFDPLMSGPVCRESPRTQQLVRTVAAAIRAGEAT